MLCERQPVHVFIILALHSSCFGFKICVEESKETAENNTVKKSLVYRSWKRKPLLFAISLQSPLQSDFIEATDRIHFKTENCIYNGLPGTKLKKCENL